MKRKPNKPKQEPRERPGSWESAADPGGAGAAGQRHFWTKCPEHGTPQSQKTLWGEEEQRSGRILAAAPPKEPKRSLRRRSSVRKSKQEQAAASKLRMEERGEKLERAKDKLAKQKPPKKPGPVRRIGRAAGGPPTVLCMARFMRMNRKTWGSRGPTALSWWASPACGMASGLCKRKSGSTRQRLSSGPSPSMLRPRRTIISAWPPRNTRKCPATLFPGCGANTA